MVGAGSVRAGYSEGIEIFVSPDDRVINVEDFPQIGGRQSSWDILVDHIVNNKLRPLSPREATIIPRSYLDIVASQLIFDSYRKEVSATPLNDGAAKKIHQADTSLPKKTNLKEPNTKKGGDYISCASVTAKRIEIYRENVPESLEKVEHLECTPTWQPMRPYRRFQIRKKRPARQPRFKGKEKNRIFRHCIMPKEFIVPRTLKYEQHN